MVEEAATKEAAVALARLQEQITAQERVSQARMAALMQLIESQAAAALAGRASSDLAVGKAEVAIEKRFDAMNEFRAQLADQAAHFATRENIETRFTASDREMGAAVEALRTRVEALERIMERSGGRGAGLNAGWGYLAGGLSLIILVVNFVFYVVSR